MPPILKRIEEWRVLLTHLGTALVLWAAGNLLLKHLYHSRHQALNCSIEIVGTLEKKELVFTLILIHLYKKSYQKAFTLSFDKT